MKHDDSVATREEQGPAHAATTSQCAVHGEPRDEMKVSGRACAILVVGLLLSVSCYLLSMIFDAEVFVLVAVALYFVCVGLALASDLRKPRAP